MTKVYLGIGSNVGERAENLKLAQFVLQKKGIRVIRTSPVYETEAVCRPGESMPKFLNGVLEVETDLLPSSLLETLEEIEKLLGRVEKREWRPRPLDLDILFYGDQIYESRRLKIPHPEIERRWFVLKPLSDLAPDFIHPVAGRRVKELLQEIQQPFLVPADIFQER